MKKIILSADSTCDLGEELIARHNVHICSYHVLLNEKDHRDHIDIEPIDLYNAYWKDKTLPRTAAINVEEYVAHFSPLLADTDCEIVHLNLSGEISSSYNNCVIAAQLLGGRVHPVDSRTLSSATGLLTLLASDMIAEGKMTAAQIAQTLRARAKDAHASFILDTLEFMAAGGRCSSIAALGANILGIRPCIQMDSVSGTMKIGRKYRGSFESVMQRYMRDQLALFSNIDTRRAFVTYSHMDSELVQLAQKTVRESMAFENVYITQACCTIASHCGPNCIGVLFMTE